ncbi:hypothetical protein B0T21DRAFT_358569, partial [Apiosordaria backusii]
MPLCQELQGNRPFYTLLFLFLQCLALSGAAAGGVCISPSNLGTYLDKIARRKAQDNLEHQQPSNLNLSIKRQDLESTPPPNN